MKKKKERNIFNEQKKNDRLMKKKIKLKQEKISSEERKKNLTKGRKIFNEIRSEGEK